MKAPEPSLEEIYLLKKTPWFNKQNIKESQNTKI